MRSRFTGLTIALAAAVAGAALSLAASRAVAQTPTQATGPPRARRQTQLERNLAGAERGQLGHRGPRHWRLAFPGAPRSAPGGTPGLGVVRAVRFPAHAGNTGEKKGELCQAADPSHEP